jgi:hypothetical protein
MTALDSDVIVAGMAKVTDSCKNLVESRYINTLYVVSILNLHFQSLSYLSLETPCKNEWKATRYRNKLWYTSLEEGEI